MDRYVRWMLYATVFVTGAAVLVIEVAAVRMLSPYYGSSLYVLSSVLTIILGALSAGYYIGGKLSDKFPFPEPLYVIITISGLATFTMEYLAMTILPQGSTLFSFFSGPLIFGSLLFFVPAFLLGIVSPYVIKLQSVHVSSERSGSVVGMTFFWGTAGSIVGSLATGFILIPLLGIKTSMAGTGLVLVALGVVVGLMVSNCSEKQGPISVFALIARNRTYLFIVILATIFLLALMRQETKSTLPHTLYEADGLYSKIVVYELNLSGERIRLLKNDTNHSSATSLDSFEAVFGYTRFAEFYKELVPDAKRFFLIGGGAYSIPRTLVARDKNLEIDVAEFEPRLFSLAQEYFDLTDISHIHNHTTDARVFLNEQDTLYDMIYGDAFSTDLSVPAHLTTREFFETVRSHLVPDGIYMMNYVGALQGTTPTLTGSLYKTLASVFPNTIMYAFDIEHPGKKQNIMFIARNGDAPLTLPSDTVFRNFEKMLTLGDLEVWTGTFDLNKEIILTDDRSPVEYLMLKQS